jgi:hypothetical protein
MITSHRKLHTLGLPSIDDYYNEVTQANMLEDDLLDFQYHKRSDYKDSVLSDLEIAKRLGYLEVPQRADQEYEEMQTSWAEHGSYCQSIRNISIHFFFFFSGIVDMMGLAKQYLECDLSPLLEIVVMLMQNYYQLNIDCYKSFITLPSLTMAFSIRYSFMNWSDKDGIHQQACWHNFYFIPVYSFISCPNAIKNFFGRTSWAGWLR